MRERERVRERERKSKTVSERERRREKSCVVLYSCPTSNYGLEGRLC